MARSQFDESDAEGETYRTRVLLADDNHEFLIWITSVLDADFDVVGHARNGYELLAKAGALQPDVVIVDISMPVMNGIDAVRKLVESASTAKFHIPHSARRTGFRECLLCCGRHGLCSQGANSGRPCQRDPGSPDGSAVCLTPPQILTPRIEQAHAHYHESSIRNTLHS